MAKRSEVMDKFGFLLGTWNLEYKVPKSAFSEAAKGAGTGTFKRALNNKYVYFDYTASLTTGDKAAKEGGAHGIFAWDEKTNVYRYWWFECSGTFMEATCNFVNDDTLFLNWHDTLITQTFGIKYPVGMQASDLLRDMRRDGQNLEKAREVPRRPMNELEILGPGKDEVEKMTIEEAKGIEIDIEFSSGMLIYELKVPLIQSELHPYAIGAKPGSSVGIGLETAKIERPDIRREMSGERVGGGPTGGMREGAGGRGMPGGRRPRMPQHLKIWAVVQLASDNTAVQE